MADPEITALRALLAARPRASEIGPRRMDIDARDRQFTPLREVRLETISAGGVPLSGR
jgi:hypothetical protein